MWSISYYSTLSFQTSSFYVPSAHRKQVCLRWDQSKKEGMFFCVKRDAAVATHFNQKKISMRWKRLIPSMMSKRTFRARGKWAWEHLNSGDQRFQRPDSAADSLISSVRPFPPPPQRSFSLGPREIERRREEEIRLFREAGKIIIDLSIE